MNRYWRARSGMTILEMSVAIVILLAMSVVVYLTLSESIEFNQLLGKRDATTRSARATLQKLRREIQVAYLTPHRNAIETVQTVFVGLDEEPDKLYFATLAHQRLYMDTRESDQAEITVWAESSPRDRGEGYILYHRESPRVDHEPGLQGRVHPLAYNVRSFNVRYLDPQTNEWRDEWDTRHTDTLYRLPRAVEIGLVLIAEDPDDPDRTVDVPFLSRFMLEYGQRLMQDFVGLAAVTSGIGGTAGQSAVASEAAAAAANGGNIGQTGNNTNIKPPLGGGSPFHITQGNAERINQRRNARSNRGGSTGSRGGTRSTPTRPTTGGGK